MSAHPDVRSGHRPPPAPWLIFSITLTGIAANPLISPSIPDILDGLGASAGSAGLLIGALTLPGIVLAPVIGLLADRYGRREVLVPCLVLFGISGGLGAAAPSVGALIVLRFLQGIGSAGLVNLAVVLIGDHWEGVERVRMIGRNAAVLTLSLALFPVLGGALTDLFGWRAPFLVYPLALLTAWLLVRRLPRSLSREVSVWEQVAEAIPILRSPALLGVLGASAATFALIFGVVLTVLPLYLETRFGLPASWRGVLLGLPAVANFTAAVNLGRLSAHFGRRLLLAAAAGAFVAALVLVAVAGTLSWLVVGLLGFGLGEGLMVPTLQEVATGAAPASSRGTIVATFVSSARLGQTLGPIGAAASLHALGPATTFVLGAGLAAVMLAAFSFGARAGPAGRVA